MTVNWITTLSDYVEHAFVDIAADGVKYVAAFCGALAVSWLLTPLLREAARKIGMVDKPDARRINKTPIPRGVGLAIFLAFHLVLWTFVLIRGEPVSTRFSCAWQVSFLLASAVLVMIGLIDDKCGMRPIVKLSGQIIAALILYEAGVSMGGIFVAFPVWLDVLVTVFWIVGAINAFNLIDGLDGLATGLALIASVGLAGALLFTGNSADTLPYLVLAGACLGFLRYNFHPASAFLGDAGSMFLGLCIATLPLITGSRKELVASLGVPLLAMGVPIFDTMLAIWRRSVRAMLQRGLGEIGHRTQVMAPDKDHLHHRLLRQTMNQRTAAIMLYGVSASLVAVGLGATLLKGRAPGLFLIAFIVAVIMTVRHLERVELWDTGRLLSGKHGTVRQGLLVPFYMAVDGISLCCVWMIARWAAEMPLTRAAFLADLPRFVFPVFLMLAVTKTYWRVWSRAQVRDFATLGSAVCTGTMIGVGLVWLFSEENSQVVFRFALLFGALAIFPISVIRLWRDSVRGVVQILERNILLDKPETMRLLAYGGGLRFRAYLRELREHSGKNNRVILGIVDDDVNLRGRIIAGYRVIGGLDKLSEWMKGQRVDGVIITCLMEAEKRKHLTRELVEMGLSVLIWDCEEKLLRGKVMASRIVDERKR